MSKVVLENLVKNYGSSRAVDGVSLEVQDGEFFALLGSSGCGKTTTLRCVAGLEREDGGRVLIDGQDMASVATSERDCGMVFQNYALFPHMSVAANVAYGLLARRYREGGWWNKLLTLLRSSSAVLPAEVGERVRQALAMVELGGLEERLPGQLSGGQQQRVALARALVTGPRVLLLDEPLGALDAKLRVRMRQEIRKIQRRAGITTLYVTHDQEEALAVADRLALLDKGRVVQVGSPEDIYLRPRNRFVAEFIGLSNVFTLQGTDRASAQLSLSDGVVLQADWSADREPPQAVALRPEALHPLTADKERSLNVLKGQMLWRMFMGSSVKLGFSTGSLEWTASVPREQVPSSWQPGSEIALYCQPADIVLLGED